MSEVTPLICSDLADAIWLPLILVTFPILFIVDEETTFACTADAHCYQGQHSKDSQNTANDST